MKNSLENTDPKNAGIPINTDAEHGAMSELSEEKDADDAVHSSKENPSEENMQQDADDAVHKNYKPAPSHENEERDPDDMVHGKG